MTADKKATRAWKVEALRYLIWMRKIENEKAAGERICRDDRDYYYYLKRFFFGDGELVFNEQNDTWQMRKAKRELPMPRNIYLYA